MLEDIRSQPDAIADALPRLRSEAAAVRTRGPFERVILTGSGDSLIASLAVQHLFEAAAEVPVVALPSLDASRFRAHHARDLVVVVSVSGEVVRTIEAARRADVDGATTVAVTANRSSTLSRICDVAVEIPAPIDRSIPHSRDYSLTLVALACLAESVAGVAFDELDRLAELYREGIDRSFAEIEASDLVSRPPGRTWFLGAGPDRPTAMFGALKYWEAAAMEAWWDDVEEFGHGSQLMARPGDRAVLIGAGLGARRAREMAPGLRKMAMEIVFVGGRDGGDGSVPILSTAGVPPPWHPFVSCVPLQVLTYRCATSLGLDVSVPWFGRDYGPTYDEVHTEWTKHGEVLSEGTHR